MEDYIYGDNIVDSMIYAEANVKFMEECMATANYDLNHGISNEEVIERINHCLETGEWLE